MSTKSIEDDATLPSLEGESVGESEDGNLTDMKKIFDTEIIDTKTGKKKSFWSVSMETFGMSGGKDGEGDLWLETVEQGIPMLKQYIKEKDLKLAEEQEQAKKKITI